MPRNIASFQTASAQETQSLGRRLAERLLECMADPGLANARVAVSGPLGCGKTQLAKGLFEVFGVERDRVVSPSFTLINEYGEGFSHLDLYRLKSWEELESLGLEEILEHPRLAVIEWAQRFDILERWGLEHLEVRMDYLFPSGGGGGDSDRDSRRIVVKPRGLTYHSLIRGWTGDPVGLAS